MVNKKFEEARFSGFRYQAYIFSLQSNNYKMSSFLGLLNSDIMWTQNFRYKIPEKTYFFIGNTHKFN